MDQDSIEIIKNVWTALSPIVSFGGAGWLAQKLVERRLKLEEARYLRNDSERAKTIVDIYALIGIAEGLLLAYAEHGVGLGKQPRDGKAEDAYNAVGNLMATRSLYLLEEDENNAHELLAPLRRLLDEIHTGKLVVGAAAVERVKREVHEPKKKLAEKWRKLLGVS